MVTEGWSLCDRRAGRTLFSRASLAAIAALIVLAHTLLAAMAYAHEGHDHDGPPPLNLPVAPRLVAVTPEFELVGVLSGKNRLTIFLHRFQTNEPVKNAKMIVSQGDKHAPATAKDDGVFEVTAPWITADKAIDLIFQLSLPNAEDFLTGRLQSVDVLGGGSSPTNTATAQLWLRSDSIIIGIGAFLLGMFMALIIGRRSKPVRQFESSGSPQKEPDRPALQRASAVVLASIVALSATDLDKATAKTRQTRAEPLPTMATDTPQRMPDGTLFVPKATQHLLSVRTIVTKTADAPRTSELVGTVIADPRGFGRVQPARPGRIAAPETGLAYVGKRVKQGELLAYLTPYIEAADKATIRSLVAEAEGRIAKLSTILSRYMKRPGAVPQVRVDEVAGELDALQKKRAELQPSLVTREEITSPVSGVVSTSNIVAGQIVNAREILFEIINPEQFWIEALSYDSTVTDNLAKAIAVTSSGRRFPLELAGQGLSLKQQMVPVMFRIAQTSPGLSIGAPVNVILQSKQRARGIVVPAASVVSSPSGLSIVWVKRDAERFSPQAIRLHKLDGQRVVITSGIKAGVRVVTEGATLLNQIR